MLESVLQRNQIQETAQVPQRGVGEKLLRRIGEDGGQVPNLLYQYLVIPAHKSHRASPVVRPEHDVYAPGGSGEGRAADNKPTGTCSWREEDLWIPKTLKAYMPPAFLVSTSMMSCLSAVFHLRITRSVLTTDLI
jgi:hypothetical protein